MPNSATARKAAQTRRELKIKERAYSRQGYDHDTAVAKARKDLGLKPGPSTPTEEIHDILGQPAMLYWIALAIAEGLGSLIEGPTGVAKTTAYRWFAKQLNWNCIAIPCSRGTEEAHFIGEYLPGES